MVAHTVLLNCTSLHTPQYVDPKTPKTEGKTNFSIFFRYHHHHQGDTSFHYDKALKIENFHTSPTFFNVFIGTCLDFCIYVYHKKFPDETYNFLFQFFCNLQRRENIL